MSSARQVVRITSIVVLLILNSNLTLIHAQTGTTARNAKPAIQPCDTLNAGGTVYDTRQCEELAAKGITFSKDKTGKITVIILPGTKSDWQVVSRSTKRVMANAPIVVRNKADHSIVAKVSSDGTGRFSLVMP